MPEVCASSRLHFGLLSLPSEGAEAPRRFGGVGLMVEQPGLVLRAGQAPDWSAEGPLAERALAFARRLAGGMRHEEPGSSLPPQHLRLESSPPEHVGLGTGTQLGLAVGRALALVWGRAWGTREIARRVGRGMRSALGVYGFEQGGFLVEAGQRRAGELAPLVARQAFPADWRVVLAIPADSPGLHGPAEQQAFDLLARQALPVVTDSLCRLVLLDLLPALVETDLPAFGQALFEFNARVGEVFAPVQGGTYAGPRVTALVEFIRGQGIPGVGQSSWGPAVFAVVGDEEHAGRLVQLLRQRFALHAGQVWATRAVNRGAEATP
jgi:beta-RFAP synthase